MRITFEAPCSSTIHKRKTDGGSDTKPACMSINIHGQVSNFGGPMNLEANIWIEDKNERQIFISLPNETLLAIHDAVAYWSRQEKITPSNINLIVN